MFVLYEIVLRFVFALVSTWLRYYGLAFVSEATVGLDQIGGLAVDGILSVVAAVLVWLWRLFVFIVESWLAIFLYSNTIVEGSRHLAGVLPVKDAILDCFNLPRHVAHARQVSSALPQAKILQYSILLALALLKWSNFSIWFKANILMTFSSIHRLLFWFQTVIHAAVPPRLVQHLHVYR